MIKILHIHLSSKISGAQRVSLDEMKTLSNHYSQYMVCSKEGDFTQEADRIGVKTYVIETLVREISPLKDFYSLIKLYKFIKQEKFDIIHTHSSKSGFLGRLAAKLAGTKQIIHTVHGFAFPSTSNRVVKLIYFLMEYFASLCSSVIIVMNENDEKIARKYFSSAPWTKVTLLNNAVDIKKFQKRYIGIESKSEINEQKKFKMVMIGRLCEQKNPLLIINALKILGDHYYVDFVGDGPLRSDLESQIAKRGLEKKVRLLGWCSSVEEIIFKYDLFLLPSKWEGMPLAILEAMASKVPVLCSNIDANAYLINKTSGFLFNNDDAKDLAKNIKYIFDNVDVRRKVAEDAYLAVVKDFELSERTKILESIYTNNYFL